MSLLDMIPDSTWFFCFPIIIAVYIITVLGIIHPLFWIKVMRVYRSELFVFMYILIGFWSFLSVCLMYAVVSESSCLYVFWIWYTIVFAIVMCGLMFLLFCGFCVLGMRRKSVAALLAIIYYLITLYFVVVVNKHRKEVFGLRPDECNTCEERRALAVVKPEPARPRPIERASTPGLRTTRTLRTVRSTTTTRTTTRPETTPTTEELPRIVVTSSTPTAFTPDMHALRRLVSPYGLRTRILETTLEYFTDKPTRSWPGAPLRRDLESVTPATPLDPDMDRGLGAIARLSDLLVNSDECRKPRKPAHGRFLTAESKRGPSMTLTLRCDAGYHENTQATTCKYNWWDRPIPTCRKQKDPPPLPLEDGSCELPGYPAHGEYSVAEHPRARPGERVRGDNVVLVVICDQPYRPVDPYVVCVAGRWRHAPPSCKRHCRLDLDPTVDYKCLKAFKDEFVACSTWQPDGVLVEPACRPGHAHRGPFRHMRCRGDTWDHIVTCLPNSNFTVY